MSSPIATAAPGGKVQVAYDDEIVRLFLIASVIFGAVALLVGVIIAAQLSALNLPMPFELNLGFVVIPAGATLADLPVSWLSFGRLRPLHTNAAIFAFVGNMIFAGVYYSTQRLCKTRLASDALSRLHFWGWQAIIVAAAITLPLGLTRGKEYAELIWPINLAVVVIWVVFAVNFFWTLLKRNEPTIYVALWFYIATIVTVAMLYIVNHLQIPTSLLHSYPIFGGVQDALVQWWYGHNAVAFFLTTPILGIMYYFIPKAAERPVYSYRLSIIHFWSLVFVYIWAGPHHLLNTALPGWLQALGMTFSLMLWAPSWGGMLNGLLTLRGAWHKLRTEPVLKFMAAGVTFYGMSTFEGPLLSINAVNALGHYGDWIIGHVHGGTLGWNGFMAAGMFYFLVPRLWNRKLHSLPLADMHFWVGMTGILLYVASMWAAGISQGLMLNATKDAGTVLAYPNFLETVQAIQFLWLTRLIGGVLYLGGYLIMVYNLVRTIWGAPVVNTEVEVVKWEGAATRFSLLTSPPVVLTMAVIFFGCVWFLVPGFGMIIGLLGMAVAVFLAIVHWEKNKASWTNWHETLLAHSMPFTALVLVAAAIGGAVQIIPNVVLSRADNVEDRLQVPYTPLELAGRDVYIREGCYNCHSQMIRTFVPDVLRYGRKGMDADFSRLGESIYDHPYQWGSKRTGPDLAHIGGKYNDAWHYSHMLHPREISAGSNMPAYPWLETQKTDYAAIPGRIGVLRLLGVPYEDRPAEAIVADAQAQALAGAQRLRDLGKYTEPDSELVALIAYLQKVGAANPVVRGADTAQTTNP